MLSLIDKIIQVLLVSVIHYTLEKSLFDVFLKDYSVKKIKIHVAVVLGCSRLYQRKFLEHGVQAVVNSSKRETQKNPLPFYWD